MPGNSSQVGVAGDSVLVGMVVRKVVVPALVGIDQDARGIVERGEVA